MLEDNGTYTFGSVRAPLVSCLDLYVDEPSVREQFQTFEDLNVHTTTLWFCMQPGTIEVLNDGPVMPSAISQQLSLNYCYLMGGELGYDTSGCQTDPDKLSSVIESL